MVREYETITRFQTKGILNVAFRQGKTFKKFKESGKFVERIKETEQVYKYAIYFKINFLKILEKYPRLKKSLLNFFKV